jgi:transcriptional regulator with XRE-family HTH domain
MNASSSDDRPPTLRGAVIRAWREYSGVGQRELARLMNVSPGAVSMWESGQRATRSVARLPLVADIASELGLASEDAQALGDMWLAAASVTALKPRSSWAHNYQWPSGPGWVWLRCPEPSATLAVSGWWSDPLQGELKMDVGAAGVFIQFPRTIPNPPLEIVFDESVGWADFGRGAIPAGVAERLGATVLDARSLARPVKPFEPPLPGHVFARLIEPIRGFKAVAQQFGPAWDLIRPHFGIARFDRPPHEAADALGPRTAAAGIEVDGSGWIVSQAIADPDQFRLIRLARGLSREAAAGQVTEMSPDHPLTASVLRAYEETGAVPAVEQVFSRLDAAFGTDGWFGLDVTHDSRSRYGRDGIAFPGYWQGPVWLQARAPEEDAVGLVDLVWGPWRRRQYVLSGTVLTTRKAARDMSPLGYEVPAGWQVRGGVGAVPTALDVNHGWYPKDIRASLSLLTTHVRAITTDRSD